MASEARHLPTFRANEERLAVLADLARDLGARFAGRAMVARLEGERPPTWAIDLQGKRFASFGVVDANYFWTFDGGVSCHYSRNRDVMRRLLVFELSAALNPTGKT